VSEELSMTKKESMLMPSFSTYHCHPCPSR